MSSFDFKSIILNSKRVVNGLTWASLSINFLVKLFLLPP